MSKSCVAIKQPPFYDSRWMVAHCTQQGYQANRTRMQRLMRQLGLHTVYPKPKLSDLTQANQLFPASAQYPPLVSVFLGASSSWGR